MESKPDAMSLLNAVVKVEDILAYLRADCFLSKASAARYIDHRDTRPLEKAIRAGRLRAYRVGKKILVRKSDLDAWVLAGEVTPASRQAERTELGRLVDAAMAAAKRNRAVRKEGTNEE